VTTEDIAGSWRKLECGRIREEWSLEEEGEKGGGLMTQNMRKKERDLGVNRVLA
jgi:hypothetical protein